MLDSTYSIPDVLYRPTTNRYIGHVSLMLEVQFRACTLRMILVKSNIRILSWFTHGNEKEQTIE